MERTWEANNNKNQKFSTQPCINVNLKPKTKEETFKIRLIKFKEEQFFRGIEVNKYNVHMKTKTKHS